MKDAVHLDHAQPVVGVSAKPSFQELNTEYTYRYIQIPNTNSTKYNRKKQNTGRVFDVVSFHQLTLFLRFCNIKNVPWEFLG